MSKIIIKKIVVCVIAVIIVIGGLVQIKKVCDFNKRYQLHGKVAVEVCGIEGYIDLDELFDDDENVKQVYYDKETNGVTWVYADCSMVSPWHD